MFSVISSGHADFADICFLVAAILFLIGGVLAYSAKAVWATLVAAGLCVLSVGWLVL